MKLKRKLACLMAVIVFVSAFGCYSDMKPEASVQAETEDVVPVYDTTCHRYTVTGATSGYAGVSYTNGVLTVPAQANAWLTTDLTDETSYYMSMNVKTSTNVNLGYRSGTGNNYFYISSSDYMLMNGSEIVVDYTKDAVCASLKNGANITMYSTPNHLKIWVEGKKVVDQDCTGLTTAKPGVSWSNAAEVTISDICIWTEGDGTVPVYNAENDILHEVTDVATTSGENATYENGVVTVPAQSNAWFTSNLPTDADYYMTMRIKSAGQLNIGYRSGNSYLWIQNNMYKSVGTGETANTSGNFALLAEGIDVTLYSASDKLEVWINGEKILNSVYSLEGTTKPGITWSFSNEIIVSNIQIWTEKPEAKPKYDTTCHRYTVTGATSGYGGFYANGVLTAPAGSNAWITSDLSNNDSYYMSMTVKTSQSVNIAYRRGSTNNTYFQIKGSGYLLFENGATVVPEESDSICNKLKTGLTVTFYSTPTHIKIWIEDKKVIDYQTSNMTTVNPGIQWATTDTATFSDIYIWSEGDGTVPVYNAEKDIMHEVTDVTTTTSGKEIVYENGIATVPTDSNAWFTSNLPTDADYYVTMRVKSAGQLNIGYRSGNGYLWMQNNMYKSVGTGETTPTSGDFALLADGIDVTFHSSSDKLEVWINGEQILDSAYSLPETTAKPGIAWSFNNEVIVSNILIWTEPDAMLKGTNATLDGSIGMNFFMGISDDTLASGDDVSMKFTVPGVAEQKVVLSEATYNETQDAYVFTYNMAAKRMSEEITAQLFVGEEAVSEAYSYTIEEYAREIIGGDYTEAEKALAQNMLHYGAYSQLYLNHNPSVLPNVGLEALDMSSVTKDDIDVSKNVLTIAGLGSIVASNLSLKSETTLKMYFAPIEGVENLTFTYGNETLTTSDYTYTDGSQWICIAITNIAANELDDTLEIGVTDGTNTGTLKYSALTYGYNVLNMTSPKETLSNLVKALYYYNASANALLEASQE